MQLGRIHAVVILMGAGMAWPAFVDAQQQPPAREPTQQPPVDRPGTGKEGMQQPGQQDSWNLPATRWQKGTDMLRKNVQTSDGTRLGQVDDWIIDENGRMTFAIVTIGGRQSAVPSTALKYTETDGTYSFRGTEDQLRARSFDRGNYPDFSDQNWAVETYRHYNQEPYWDTTKVQPGSPQSPGNAHGASAGGVQQYQYGHRYTRASELIGSSVADRQAGEIGRIEDLSIDPDTGRVMYPIMSMNESIRTGDNYYPVPWSSFQSGEGRTVTLNVQQDRLRQAPGFGRSQWPNMSDQRWASGVYSYYGQKPYWNSDGKNNQAQDDRDRNTQRELTPNDRTNPNSPGQPEPKPNPNTPKNPNPNTPNPNNPNPNPNPNP